MKPNSIRIHATARRMIVAIGLPLAGWGAFAVFRPQAELAPPVMRASTAALIANTVSNPSSSTPHQWKWPAGASATYQIRQTVDIASGNGDLAPEACGRTIIEGKLKVHLIDAAAASVSLAVQLSDMAVSVDPAGETPQRRETVIENMLNSNAGLLELDREGRVLSCRLPAALANDDRTMLQGLMAIEFVLGEGPRWESEEKLQGAACRSFYQTSGGAAVAKTREALPVPEGQPALHIRKSAFTAVPGPFWIETLDGSEQLEYIWQNQRVCLANTTLKISRHEETQTPHELATLIADPAKREALVDGASLTSHDESVRESARDRQHMAQLVEQYEPIPADRMIDDLVTAVDGSDEHADTIPAMHALRDWLLANPSRSNEIAEGLKTPDFSDSVTARMTHALELAGKKSKESQSALASIIGSAPGEFPSAVLMQAAVAAGGVGQVLSPDLMPALSQMASAEDPGEDYSLSNAALFALGSLARENPELGDSLVETLSPWLDSDSTHTTENQATALRALGNAGISDSALMDKALALRATHADAQVRMAAVDYFASLSSPEAVQALGEALAKDPSEDVRRVALNALTQPESVSSERLRPVLDLIRKPGDGGTLQELAIANLAPFQDAFPEIRDAFRRLLPQARGKSADLLRQSLAANP